MHKKRLVLKVILIQKTSSVACKNILAQTSILKAKNKAVSNQSVATQYSQIKSLLNLRSYAEACNNREAKPIPASWRLGNTAPNKHGSGWES